MKRLFPVLLALLLALSACGGKTPAPETSAPVPEAPSSAPETSAPATPAPEPPDEQHFPQADDALVREIIKTYGAREEVGPDGVSRLVAVEASLLDHFSNWDSVEELTTMAFYSWFLTTTYQEDPDQRRERYSHPDLEEMDGIFYPQDLFEERVQRYFRASSRQLRSGAPYDPQRQGYWLPISLGIGESAIEYSYTQDKGGALRPPPGGRLRLVLPPGPL